MWSLFSKVLCSNFFSTVSMGPPVQVINRGPTGDLTEPTTQSPKYDVAFPPMHLNTLKHGNLPICGADT